MGAGGRDGGQHICGAALHDGVGQQGEPDAGGLDDLVRSRRAGMLDVLRVEDLGRDVVDLEGAATNLDVSRCEDRETGRGVLEDVRSIDRAAGEDLDVFDEDVGTGRTQA